MKFDILMKSAIEKRTESLSSLSHFLLHLFGPSPFTLFLVSLSLCFVLFCFVLFCFVLFCFVFLLSL